MSALDDILTWLKTKPLWQQDALRRLVQKGSLDDEKDITELTAILKHDCGLEVTLDQTHLATSSDAGADAVTLEEIHHNCGVNALANDQILTFGSKLTVVYGENGAGKSGYTRILKKACRARGAQGDILHNVFEVEKEPPKATITYKPKHDSSPQTWELTPAEGGQQASDLARVSVFDTHSAAVYLNDKTDVAFRPFGLDLLDKLANAAGQVQGQLDAEVCYLGEELESTLNKLQSKLPEHTLAANLIEKLKSAKETKQVREIEAELDTLATPLTVNETASREHLEKQLTELQTANPEQALQKLELLSGRVTDLQKHVKLAISTLSDKSVSEIDEARTAWQRKQTEAETLRATMSKFLPGTGGDTWKRLWASAEQFSTQDAYPGDGFPVVGDGKKCVLCQQDLSQDASARLQEFAKFTTSKVERELSQADATYKEKQKKIHDLEVQPKDILETIKDLNIEYQAFAERIQQALDVAQTRFIQHEQHNSTPVIQRERSESQDPADFSVCQDILPDIEQFLCQLKQCMQNLSSTDTTKRQRQIEQELNKLRAQQCLFENRADVQQAIRIQKKIIRYEACKKKTDTTTITKKSGDLTKKYITEKVTQAFQNELKKLGFTHIELKVDQSNSKGKSYHKLVFKDASDKSLPDILSEGEGRLVALAAFLTELANADHQSAIIFDDPVSSLDVNWRRQLAARLVDEATRRQVIVFTHDLVFLVALKEVVEEVVDEKMGSENKFLCHRTISPKGKCSLEEEWIVKNVDEKIKCIRKKSEQHQTKYEGDPQSYQYHAHHICVTLRETWESAIEEVLLNKIVLRYRKSVTTQGRIRGLAVIDDELCTTADKAMTELSRYVHSQSPSDSTPILEPNTLNQYIVTLEDWVHEIKKRRKEHQKK